MAFWAFEFQAFNMIYDRSVVTATVLYDSNSVVDISQIQKRLLLNNSTSGISIRDNTNEEVWAFQMLAMHFGISIWILILILFWMLLQSVYKAENRVLFWILIAFALLIALAILTLLLCCACPWCPLYHATRWVWICFWNENFIILTYYFGSEFDVSCDACYSISPRPLL